MINRKYSTWISYIAIFFLSFSTILKTYGYGGFLNFSRFLGLLLAVAYVFYFFKRRVTTNVLPTSLNRYFYWLLFVGILTSTSVSDIIPLGDIERYIVFLAVFSFVPYDSFLPVYKRVAYVCLFFLLFQELIYSLGGYRISGIMSFLPLDFSENVDTEVYLERVVSDNWRSSSFFSEPAHYVQYILPLLAIELFNAKKMQDWIKVLLILSSILLTKSGNGLFGLFSIFVIYVIYLYKNLKANRLVVFPLFLLILGLSAVYYVKTGDGQQLLERQTELTSDVEVSSGFLRVLRGFYVYAEFSPIEKVIGVNNLDRLGRIIGNSKVSFTFLEGDFYFNTFQEFLLNTGIIGGIFFFVIFIGLMRNNSYVGKAITFCFMLMSFYSALYLSPMMILYVFLAYNMKINNKKVLYEKNNACLRYTSRSN